MFSRASSRLLGAEFDTAARWFPQERDDLYAVRARVRAGSLFGRPPVDELYITAMERDNDLWLRGRTGGRPPKLTEHDIEAAKAMLANPDIAVTQIVQRLGVSPGASLSVSSRCTNREYPG